MDKGSLYPTPQDEKVGDKRKDRSPPYRDPNADLRGWPGHRTRPERSGLDPLDNDFELAHMEGVFLRRLFTGKLRTRNLFYLFLMAVFGLFACLPLLFILAEVVNGNYRALLWLILFSPVLAAGLALLANLALNLRALLKVK